MKIVPPNFGYVEEGIFRCGMPVPRNYSFLASLDLRTCILLSDTREEAFSRWLEECGIRVMQPLADVAMGREQQDGSSSSLAKKAEESVNSGDGATPHGPQGPLLPVFSNHSGLSAVTGAAVANAGDESLLQLPNHGRDSVSADPPLDVTGNFEGVVAEASNNQLLNTTFDGVPRSVASPPHTTEDFRPQQFLPRSQYRGGTNMERFLKEHRTGRYSAPAYSSAAGRDAQYSLVKAVQQQKQPYWRQPSQPMSGPMTLPEYVVVDVLHCLIDPIHYPVLIACSRGRYRTGLVCGCLRKLQRWNLVSILEEYRRYAGNQSRPDNEEFIEFFYEGQVNLKLPGGRRPTILYN